MINGRQLVDYAKAQLGKPYWFGTFGSVASEQLWSEKSKQYSRYYSDKRHNIMISRGDIGQKVHDCVGLYKGALWSKGPDMPAEYHAAQDISADGAFKNATEKGPIGSIPEIVGLGVYRKGHVGIYIGGGRVVQAKGFDYGVIESDTEGFTDWFKYPDVDYTDCEIVTPQPEIPEPAADPEPAPEGKIYTVVAGDTLTKIANACDPKTTAAELGRINGIENLDLIQIGQQIRLPAGTEIGAAAPEVWLGIVNTVKDPLRVRTGRGTQYPIVKLLPKGSMIEIQGEAQDGWHELADGSGFVSANFIVK